MNKENVIYVVVFTFVVAFAFVFLLALADNATRERVEANQRLVIAEAFLGAAGIGIPEDRSPLDAFESTFPGASDDDTRLRASVDGSDIVLSRFTGQGLWGTITGVLAVTADAGRIVGLDIISHSETPGLGGRIEESWFKDQFTGEVVPPGGITVRKGEGGADVDTENGVIDGITGATLTSDAMQTIVNAEIDALRKEAGT